MLKPRKVAPGALRRWLKEAQDPLHCLMFFAALPLSLYLSGLMFTTGSWNAHHWLLTQSTRLNMREARAVAEEGWETNQRHMMARALGSVFVAGLATLTLLLPLFYPLYCAYSYVVWREIYLGRLENAPLPERVSVRAEAVPVSR